MTVLVTGASGFIGNRLVQKLLTEEVEVIGISRKKITFEKPRFKFLSLDLADEKALRKIPRKIDVIFHNAAYIPPDTNEKYFGKCFSGNVMTTANIVKFTNTNQIKQLIVSSSISVYGIVTIGKINESYTVQPTTFYGFSKKIAEDVVSGQLKNTIPYTILRYSSVYGPCMKQKTVVTQFIKQIKRGENITIWGSGERTQDFVYIDDVVNANIKASVKKSKGLYLIGSGTETSLKDLAETIKSFFPTSKNKIIYDESKPEDQQRVCLDYTKANEAFGYKPKYSLKEGLRKII